MSANLPPLCNTQEYGNVPYVVDGGFGVYTGNSPRRIADKVSENALLRCVAGLELALKVVL
jgi:hypothetical protein